MADEIAVLMHVPEIEGSSTLVGTDPGSDGSHEGWIPIESASFSFSRETTAVDPEADHDDLLARYPKATVGDLDGQPNRLTEMDAMVAYLQILGRMVDFSGLEAEALQQ